MARQGQVGLDNNDETGKKVNIADVAGEHVQIDSYLSYPFGGSNPSVSAGEMCKTMGEKLPKALGGSNADTMGLFVTPASQYNKLRQMMGEEPGEHWPRPVPAYV